MNPGKKRIGFWKPLITFLGGALFIAFWGLRFVGAQFEKNPLRESSAKTDMALAPEGIRVKFYSRGGTAAGRIVYVHGSPGNSGNFSSYVMKPVTGMEAIAIDRLGREIGARVADLAPTLLGLRAAAP